MLTPVDIELLNHVRAKRQTNLAIQVKTLLIHRGQSLAGLGRSLKPSRPRSTVSQAIHTNRFPKVREQIKEALCL